MADEIIKRDENHTTVIAAVTNDANQFITQLRVDPTTKALLTDAVLSGDGLNQLAALSTASGTISVDTTAGGTQVIAANAKRMFAQCENNGSVNVYFGTGTVTSSFLVVVPGGTFTWHSQEALKCLAASGSASIAFCDYTNV